MQLIASEKLAAVHSQEGLLQTCPQSPTVNVGPGTPPRKTPESIVSHYPLIAEVLMVAESSQYTVGIPWLPPTRSTRELRKKFQGPLDEYLRLSLVSVPTKALESYCEDLDIQESEANRLSELYIRTLAHWERLLCIFILVVLIFAFCSLVLVSVAVLGFGAWLLAGSASAAAGFAGLFFVGEAQRRLSLQQTLYREILRRSGVDPSNSKGLNLLSLET